MKAKFVKLEYIIKKLNSFINEKIKISNFINYVQAYIKSDIIEAFKKNYIILIKTFKTKDQKYIS